MGQWDKCTIVKIALIPALFEKLRGFGSLPPHRFFWLWSGPKDRRKVLGTLAFSVHYWSITLTIYEVLMNYSFVHKRNKLLSCLGFGAHWPFRAYWGQTVLDGAKSVAVWAKLVMDMLMSVYWLLELLWRQCGFLRFWWNTVGFTVLLFSLLRICLLFINVRVYLLALCPVLMCLMANKLYLFCMSCRLQRVVKASVFQFFAITARTMISSDCLNKSNRNKMVSLTF